MAKGKIYSVMNIGQKTINFGWDGEVWSIAAGATDFIIFPALANMLGDPRAKSFPQVNEGDTIPTIQEEKDRLSRIYGCYYQYDQISERAPKVIVKDTSGEQVVFPAQDPNFESTFEFKADTPSGESQIAKIIEAHQIELANLRKMFEASQRSTPMTPTPEDSDPEDFEDLPSRAPLRKTRIS